MLFLCFYVTFKSVTSNFLTNILYPKLIAIYSRLNFNKNNSAINHSARKRNLRLFLI